MPGEVIAFGDTFDCAIALLEDLCDILLRQLPVQLLTDNESLSNVIPRGSHTSEKSTILDVAASQEAFQDRIISNIGFVLCEHNIADGLTKLISQAALRTSISSGKINPVIGQWILRTRRADAGGEANLL